MAVARVYVGAHYPGDVAGGIVIGVLVALAGWPLAVRVLEPLAARLTRSPLRPLVFARDT
jgi:membrane-associated phospholipid phosphatase